MLNEMEQQQQQQRNSFVSTFLWGWRQSCQTSKELTELCGQFGVAHVTWRNRDAKEPLYFFMMTPALTKPDHCVLSRRAKCLFFTHTPYSPDYGLCSFCLLVLLLFSSDDEGETGRTEVFYGYKVCQQLSEQTFCDLDPRQYHSSDHMALKQSKEGIKTHGNVCTHSHTWIWRHFICVTSRGGWFLTVQMRHVTESHFVSKRLWPWAVFSNR